MQYFEGIVLNDNMRLIFDFYFYFTAYQPVNYVTRDRYRANTYVSNYPWYKRYTRT